MATIISNRPYNDWRERLAVDIIGGLVGNMIKNSQQANQNRKLNALRGVVQDELSAMNAPQQQAVPQLMAGTGNDSSNGWQNAFHSMENPMAQFDAGTAGFTAPSVTPQVNNYPNQADIQGIIARNLASKRFSMLDPKLVQETLTPYLLANEAARMEQRRQGVVDDYMNAPDALAKRNVTNAAYLKGLIDLAGMNAFQNQYVADRPTPVSFNTGGNIVYGNRDPITGQISIQDRIPMELTPGQVQQGNQWQQNFNANERQRGIDNDFRQSQADRAFGLQERAQNEAETQAEWNRNNSLIKTPTGTYRYNPDTGEFEEIKSSDGKPIIMYPDSGYGRTGNGNISSRTSLAKSVLNNLYRQKRDYEKKLDEAQKQKDVWASNPSSPQYMNAQAAIKRLETEIKHTQNKIDRWEGLGDDQTGYSTERTNKYLEDLESQKQALNKVKDKISQEEYNFRLQEIEQQQKFLREMLSPENSTGQVAPYPPSSSSSSSSEAQKKSSGANLGSMFLGNAYGGNLTPSKRFGAKRNGNPKLGVKPHSHAGIDLEARHGSPISVPDILGEDVRVVDVQTSPKGGLGCHVVLEGTVNGQRYTYVLAHMAEGSIGVSPGDVLRPGDLIGKVGNTGNSSGPHLHFEVRTGGRRGKAIDPEGFFADYNSRQPQQAPSQPSAPSVTPEPTPAQPVISGDVNQLQIGTQPQSGDVAPQTTQENAPRRQKQSAIYWYNPKTRDTIRDKEYENVLRQVEAGKVRGVKNEEDLHNLLRSQGYTNSEPIGLLDELGITPSTSGTNEMEFIDRINSEIAQNRAKQGAINSNAIPETNAPSLTVTSPDVQLAVPSYPTSGDNSPSLTPTNENLSVSTTPSYTDRINGTTKAQDKQQMDYLNGVSNPSLSLGNLPQGYISSFFPRKSGWQQDDLYWYDNGYTSYPTALGRPEDAFPFKQAVPIPDYTGPAYGTPEFDEYFRKNMRLL